MTHIPAIGPETCRTRRRLRADGPWAITSGGEPATRGRLICSGFEEFAHALQGAVSRVMLAGPEESGWRVRVRGLPRLSVQMAQEGVVNIYEGASWPDAVNLLLPMNRARLKVNGAALDTNSIAILSQARGHCLDVPETTSHRRQLQWRWRGADPRRGARSAHGAAYA